MLHKKTSSWLVLLFGITLTTATELYSEVKRFDRFTYNQIGSKVSQNEIRAFHDLVEDVFTTVEEDFKISFQHRVELLITGNAQLFYKLTGHNWQTAAVYIPGKRQIVLQNLDSLNRFTSIERILSHEICHLIFNHYQQGKDQALEEALCLAYAGMSYYDAPVPERITKLEELKAAYRTGQQTGQARQVIYKQLAGWGRYLLKENEIAWWLQHFPGNARLQNELFQVYLAEQ